MCVRRPPSGRTVGENWSLLLLLYVMIFLGWGRGQRMIGMCVYREWFHLPVGKCRGVSHRRPCVSGTSLRVSSEYEHCPRTCYHVAEWSGIFAAYSRVRRRCGILGGGRESCVRYWEPKMLEAGPALFDSQWWLGCLHHGNAVIWRCSQGGYGCGRWGGTCLRDSWRD
jgi:hypothetical protein